MPITPPPDATDFATAADNLRRYALDQFNAAFRKVNVALPAPLPSNATAEQKEAAKTQAAELAKAQGQMAAAFTQIADAERQAAEATGYASIVALMATTATRAHTICARIEALMGAANANPVSQAALNEIAQLHGTLTALAALSPASLWDKAPPPSASAQ